MKRNHKSTELYRVFFAACYYTASMLGSSALIGAAQAGDVFNGQKLYQLHCASCHGANGRPVLPGAADFSRGQGLMQTDIGIAQVVLYGKNSMPGFKGVLRESEVLDVISYIRTL